MDDFGAVGLVVGPSCDAQRVFGAAELGDGFGEGFRTPRGDHHPASFVDDAACHGESDASAGARHHRDFAFETFHGTTPCHNGAEQTPPRYRPVGLSWWGACGSRPPLLPSPDVASHYFDSDPTTPSRTATVTLLLPDLHLRLATDRGVFSPDRIDLGTRILLETVPPPPDHGTLLDLGCGYGPIALAMALRAPKATVVGIDTNQRALALARRNAEDQRCPQRLLPPAPGPETPWTRSCAARSPPCGPTRPSASANRPCTPC